VGAGIGSGLANLCGVVDWPFALVGATAGYLASSGLMRRIFADRNRWGTCQREGGRPSRRLHLARSVVRQPNSISSRRRATTRVHGPASRLRCRALISSRRRYRWVEIPPNRPRLRRQCQRLRLHQPRSAQRLWPRWSAGAIRRLRRRRRRSGWSDWRFWRTNPRSSRGRLGRAKGFWGWAEEAPSSFQKLRPAAILASRGAQQSGQVVARKFGADAEWTRADRRGWAPYGTASSPAPIAGRNQWFQESAPDDSNRSSLGRELRSQPSWLL